MPHKLSNPLFNQKQGTLQARESNTKSKRTPAESADQIDSKGPAIVKFGTPFIQSPFVGELIGSNIPIINLDRVDSQIEEESKKIVSNAYDSKNY